MQSHTLARSGLRVSETGGGGALLGIPNYNEHGDAWAVTTTHPMLAALQRTLEPDSTYFATAPSYGDGRSHELRGQALASRRQVYLTTMTGWPDRTRDWVIWRGCRHRLLPATSAISLPCSQ